MEEAAADELYSLSITRWFLALVCLSKSRLSSSPAPRAFVVCFGPVLQDLACPSCASSASHNNAAVLNRPMHLLDAAEMLLHTPSGIIMQFKVDERTSAALRICADLVGCRSKHAGGG